MNRQKWEGLSAKTKRQIDSVSGEFLVKIAGNQWDERDKQALKLMKDAGIKTTVASKDDIAKVRAIGQKLEAAWIKEVGKIGVDGAAALKMIKAEAASLTN